MDAEANPAVPSPILRFRASGKLLLTGEYLVVYGGLALALPVRFGQTLTVSPLPESTGELLWNSVDEQGEDWLVARFSLRDFSVLSQKGPSLENPFDNEPVNRLQHLLQLCRQANPDFLSGSSSLQATTQLEFPATWGLGSSSTLVSLLAQWSETNPFDLQKTVFGGSGYDIACATAPGPILYKLVDGKPRWETVVFNPSFSTQLFFIHLGKKQDSRFSLASFYSRGINPTPWFNTLVHLTMQLRYAAQLSDFAEHLRKHEETIAALTGLTPVQSLHFADFTGVVKSLGAWGGDFVLACTELPETAAREYFLSRGFSTFLTWKEMVG